MKSLRIAASVIGALVVIVSATLAVESRYAKEVQVAELGAAFQKYQVEQSIDSTTNRLWDASDRLKKQPKNEELQKQIRELTERKERLKEQLNQIEKGGK